MGEHIFNGHAHGEVQMFKLSELTKSIQEVKLCNPVCQGPRLNDEKN